MKILIVEDEEKLARFVELELMHEGYETSKAFDGRTGLDLAVSGEFDLVLLDIMLPGINGIEVLRRIRKTSDIPVILLTARDSVMDKVSGLDTGADDYITKPFEIEELLARIRASLRKKSSSPASLSAQLSCGMLKMDTASHIVNYGNDTVELTNKEFKLLQKLLENKSIVLSREVLLEDVWGFDYMGETNIVDVYIRYIRSKIDDIYNVKIIHTVRGVGYVIRE
ncbi:MAG: response regulator transcription factor [Ruminococcus sp.]|nr:response regulator transcription factor [Ruminococcus sp.]MBP1564377.1 response regulator transcription factor [Oscillospiraceae bacterium]